MYRRYGMFRGFFYRLGEIIAFFIVVTWVPVFVLGVMIGFALGWLAH